MDLCINLVDAVSSLIEGLEDVVSAPFDDLLDVAELSHGFVLGAVLNDTPTENCHGEGTREPKLDVVPGIVIAARQICSRLPITHRGIATP